MSKFIPLFFVLFVGEVIMRHVHLVSAIHPLGFLILLLFCLVFWRMILLIGLFILKALAAIFFLSL